MKQWYKKTSVFVLGIVAFSLLIPQIAFAHCPLCTIGAGAAAVLAASFGVKLMSIGVFIGAFAVALGFWVARILPKQYVPYQLHGLVALSFLTTVIPLLPMMTDYSSVYISFMGDYGSLLNRTYLINLFLVGAFVGGVLMVVSPYISRAVSRAREGKTLPYQGMSITFLLLLLTSLFFEFLP